MLRRKVIQFYVEIDDFYKGIEPQFKNQLKLEDNGKKRRNRKGQLSDSEMMSILLLFHRGHFTNFKWFYK